MNLNDPIEHDEVAPLGDDDSAAEDPKDELHGDSEDSGWLDDETLEPAEAVDPPDWLFQEVGLNEQTLVSPRGDELDIDDIMKDIDTPEEKSKEVSYLDWFGESVDTAMEESSTNLDETWVGSKIDLETTRVMDAGIGQGLTSEKDQPVDREVIDSSGSQVGEKQSSEDALESAEEDLEFNQEDERDELEGELKWLEELAANDSSDDTIPGVENDLESLGALPEEDFIPDWLKADVLNEASMEDPTLTFPGKELFPETPDQSLEDQSAASQVVSDWLREQMVNDTLSVQMDDAEDIDWFQQIIAGDETAIDELLAIQGMELISEGDDQITVGTEEQPSWLLELDSFDEAEDDDKADEPSDAEILAWSSETPEVETDSEESTFTVETTAPSMQEDIPSDPEEAMAWLEQLALDQGSAEDELEDSAGGLVSDEFKVAALEFDEGGMPEEGGDLEIDVPEDPDEAMAWLERLAAEQDARDDELAYSASEYVPETIVGETSEKEDEELAQALAVIAAIAMPADDGEALIWLEELAVGDDFAPVEPDDFGPAEEDFTLEQEYLGVETEPDEAQIVEEGPIDLESVQVAALMSEISDDFDDDVDDGIELEDIVEMGSETVIAAQVVETVIDEVVESQFEEIVEAEAEDASDRGADDLAWLDSLDEANVTGWLIAEERLLEEEKASTGELNAARIVPTVDREGKPVDPYSEPDQRLEDQHFSDHGVPRLAAAQSALQNGQLAEAKANYSVLVDSGESLPYVIADLEIAVEAYGDQPDLMKLLGDAYSRNGQLQKAIEIYRQALNNL
jgi:tetratricopeptide (TPR) repeat protein